MDNATSSSMLGLEDIAQLLLAKGANVNPKAGKGATALHTTARLGKSAMVQLLLKNGAEVELKSNNGETALQKAAMNRSEEVVKVILKHQGLDSDAEKWLRQAHFYNAVCEGEETTVRLLLEKGVDMTVKNVRGEHPIHWATSCGHKEIVSLLLQRADIDARDKFEETALLLACKERDKEIVPFLLDNGADINVIQGRDGDKCTVLSWATAWGEPRLVELLLKRGANPKSVDVDSLKRAQIRYARRL